MPKSVFNLSDEPKALSGGLAEEKAKDLAKAMFFNENVPNLNSIANAVGMHPRTVSRWRDAENWQGQRHEIFTKRAEELEATGCDSKQLAVEDLKICKDFKERLKSQMRNIGAGQFSVDDNLTLIKQLEKVREIQKDCLKHLGQL
jgi:hypothetical protein